MTLRRTAFALFALLCVFALATTVAAGPPAQNGTPTATPQLEIQIETQAEPAAPAAEATPLLTDPETLLFGARPQACQCEDVGDCPWYCNAACVGEPCGYCAC
jgi:hypothetical protein